MELSQGVNYFLDFFFDNFPNGGEEEYLNWLDKNISEYVSGGFSLINSSIIGRKIRTPSGNIISQRDILRNLEGRLIFGDINQIESLKAWDFLQFSKAYDGES